MSDLKDYVVYKILLEDGYEYIGSTCNYKKRMNNHISMCYNENDHYNKPLYKHIRDNNLKFSKDNFEVLEKVENINKTQARMIEEKHMKERVIQGGNVLNGQRSYRTEAEMKEGKKQYRLQNREKILKKQKEKYTCICGSTLTIIKKARHERSLKHLNYISTTQ